MGGVGKRRCPVGAVQRWSVRGRWPCGPGALTLEVISALAGGSSAHARPSVGVQSGQASLRSPVLPRSPARRLESSLNGGPSEHKRTQACLTRTPGMEPNLATGQGEQQPGIPPPDACHAFSCGTGHGDFLKN